MAHLAHLGWALWLSAPLAVTLLASIGLWWRGRTPHPPGIDDSIAAHREYLRILGSTVAVSAVAVSTIPAGAVAGADVTPSNGRAR